LVFSPLVAFDAQCHRIGRGAGYYDHTFSFVKTDSVKRPLLIGLGYEFQKVADTEPSKWDVSMDHIMTEADHYHRHD
jgi:5-formyltetrahydrofolate cyclo-ligase